MLLAGILGLALAAYVAPRRLGMPLVLGLIGLATFGLVGVAGLSIIQRYLLVPSLMVMVFAAVAIAGWTMLEPGTRARRAWSGPGRGAGALRPRVHRTHVRLGRFDSELRFRDDYHGALDRVLSDPRVRAGMRCGPVSVPNHKLIPDVRWLADLGRDDVIARSDPAQRHRLDRGVALYVTGRYALFRQAFVTDADDPLDQVPLPGYERVAVSSFYGAYVRCPA